MRKLLLALTFLVFQVASQIHAQNAEDNPLKYAPRSVQDMPTPIFTADGLYIQPMESEYWTGYIVREWNPWFPVHQKYDKDIVCGDLLYGEYKQRGWAVFDISAIPDGANILEIELHSWTSSEGSEDHCLAIMGNLPCDPRTWSGEDLWDCLGQGTMFHNNSCLQWGHAVGHHSDDLNNNARSNLKETRADGQNWWAIAFLEPGDDAGMAWFSGWDNHWPYAFVQFEMTDISEGDSTPVLSTFFLGECYPNPFNIATIIPYGIDRNSHVVISIYDIAGRQVRTLLEAEESPGYKEVMWDGTNREGQTVPSGIYFYRVTVGDFSQCKRMTLLK